MDKLHTQIEAYFSKRLEEDPYVTERGMIHGWFEGARVLEFQKFISENRREIDNIRKPNNTTLYEILGNTTAIIAQIENDEILWIDDHTSNIDFSKFLRVEPSFLFNSDANSTAQWLIQTKFNYLGRPKLLNCIHDIDIHHVMLRRKKSREKHLQELAMLQEQIREPVQYYETTILHTKFSVWTHIGGNVVSINTRWDGHIFEYRGEIIGTSIGDYVMPR